MFKVIGITVLYAVLASLGIAWFGSLFTLGKVGMFLLSFIGGVSIVSLYTIPALKVLGSSGGVGNGGNSKVS